MNGKARVPGWMVFVVVVVTAAASAWALGGRKWPPRFWSAIGIAAAQQPAAASMIAGGLGQPGSFVPVAATRSMRVIPAGAVAPHIDRGTCTSCHTVTRANGQPIPVISAQATPVHPWRGLCTNCHAVRTASAARLSATPAAAIRAQPAGAQPAGAQPAGAQPAPAEGEWLGLEVAPLNAVTAAQFNLPKTMQGVVVAEAEAQAGAAGAQAGDIVVSINGRPIHGLRAFLQVTKKGTLAAGDVLLSRQGSQILLRLGGATAAGGARAAGAGGGRFLPATGPNSAVRPNPVRGQQAGFARMVTPWALGTPVTGDSQWLGIEVVPLSPLIANQYGIPAGLRGLIVTRVGVRAAAAGMQAGDVVVAINGAPVDDMRSFFELTGRGALRGAVITVLRGGTPVRVVV